MPFDTPLKKLYLDIKSSRQQTTPVLIVIVVSTYNIEEAVEKRNRQLSHN